MGLQESRGKIATGFKDLMAHWSSTTVQWNDANSHHLETTYLKPLEADIRMAAMAMDQMAVLLSQVKRECE